jgi:hypothetical protein
MKTHTHTLGLMTIIGVLTWVEPGGAAQSLLAKLREGSAICGGVGCPSDATLTTMWYIYIIYIYTLC